MAGEYLFEAFQELDDLEETTFEVSDDGIKKVEATLEAEDDDTVEVYDTEAESEEDLEGSYIGKVILDCPVCRSKIYRDPDAVVIAEEEELVNNGEECPYCMQADGYKIIGQVSEYGGADDSDDVEVDVDEVVDEDETEDLGEAFGRKKGKTFNFGGENDRDVAAYYDAQEHARKFARGYKKATTQWVKGVGWTVTVRDRDADAATAEYVTLDGYPFGGKSSGHTGAQGNQQQQHTDGRVDTKVVAESAPRKKRSAKGSVRQRLEAHGIKVAESVGTDVGEYQKWVDYDMERYGKVSKTTLEKLKKAGLTVVKDKYGDLEVIAHENIHESVKSVSVETDDTRIEVSPEGEGAINVHAEDLGTAEEGDETIVPLTDETLTEIEGEEELSEEPSEEDIEIDEFSEEEVDELGEAYLKRVYENVESYKTTKGSTKGNRMVFEGVITFKSGRKTATRFVFEAHEKTKTGKLRFLGENKTLSGNSKAFTLTGRATGKKLVCESLRYNYRARDAKTGKTTPISGAVHTSKK